VVLHLGLECQAYIREMQLILFRVSSKSL